MFIPTPEYYRACAFMALGFPEGYYWFVNEISC